MDSTPIYTELRNTLIDPEEDHWTHSAPPEFLASLENTNEQSQQSESDSGGTHGTGEQASQANRRGTGRRHRAED